MNPNSKEGLAAKFRKMGIDEKVISAFEKVKREDFMIEENKEFAYKDVPQPILAEQTISQPTTVILMLDALDLEKDEKVLEIGAGSGYNAALLGEICSEGRVISVEYIRELANFAKDNIEKAGYRNVEIVQGDGSGGLPERAPFTRIICTSAIPEIPEPWVSQLVNDGIIVAPVGPISNQKMTKLQKAGEGRSIKKLGDFMFVPTRGEYGYKQ